MIKSKDFFKGLDEKKYKEIIDALINGKKLEVTEKEIDKINANSTRIFRAWHEDDIIAFEDEDDDNRTILHWVAGLNTREYLKIYKRD